MPRQTPENLRPLTSLRYLAALWVVAYHYWPQLSSAPAPRLVAKGYLGVELFFVLSGFILSHVYLESFGRGRFGYGAFLWARLARIYPAHLATLAGLGLMAAIAARTGMPVGDQVLIWPSLPAELTLTQAWGLAPQGGWNHPSWSISAEWFAYLAFPGFAWASWKLRSRPAGAVALALALLTILDLGFERLAGFPLTEATIAWGALRIVPCFALGCALYLLWRARPADSRGFGLARAAAYAAGAAGAIAAGAPEPLCIGLFGAVIYALAALPRAGSRLLSSGLFVYLGEVSFSLYMICIPWELAFAKLAHRLLSLAAGPLPWPLWVVMIAGATPVAMALHHLVEQPARLAMRRGLSVRLAPGAGADQAASFS
ncbi:MAG: acyltransferase [Caulobacteraceae bacterium]|nr:acyltransferase [Caulobacteraceae bacterium]